MTSLAKIQKEIAEINPETRILAVSKLQSTQKIEELHSQGQVEFAENYVQEALEKLNQLARLRAHWHFIGHLQKNKIKQVVGKFELIHSVDSLELAKVIDKKSLDLGICQKILIQINLSGETTKGGFSKESFLLSIQPLMELKSISIQGLMTMPPLFADPEKARPYFRELRELRDSCQPKFPEMRQLSMGTSSDYLVAASEGATWVRLGTILFGERPKQ